MVTVKLQDPTLLALSIAEQETKTLPKLVKVNGLVALQEVAFLMPELSVAEGIVQVATAPTDVPLVALVVTGPGQVTVGGALSAIVTGNVHVLELVALSVAVQTVFVVVPT